MSGLLTTTTTNEMSTPAGDMQNLLGKSVTDLVGFHGKIPTVQRAGEAQAAVPTTAAATTSYGYSEAQANAIVTLLNEIRAALVEKGIIKGGA